MCDLCTTYGQNAITDRKKLKKAMAAINPAAVNSTNSDHLVTLVNAWIGMPSEVAPDDPVAAEAWERSHR